MTASDTAVDKAKKRKRAEETLKWGTGLFENDVDLHIIRDFARELAFADTSLNSLLHLDNEKALAYRRKLDAGALNKLLKRHLPLDYTSILANENNKNSTRTWPPERGLGYRLCLLGAAVMRLGCVVSPDFRHFLEELHAKVGFFRNAQVQLRHALNVYVDGIPYNFREKPRPVGLGKSSLMDDHIWGDIGENLIDLGDNPDPTVDMFSRLILGPMLKCTAAGDNQHPQNACGNCGRTKTVDGSPCRPCSDCGQRLYCSRKCELANRSMHQLVCKDPYYRVMGNAWAKARNAVNDEDAQEALWNGSQHDQSTDDDDNPEGHENRGPTDSGLATPGSTTSGSSNTETNSMSDCGSCGIAAPLNRRPLLCSKCNEQHYCSRKCQKEHWSEHKKRYLGSTSS